MFGNARSNHSDRQALLRVRDLLRRPDVSIRLSEIPGLVEIYNVDIDSAGSTPGRRSQATVSFKPAHTAIMPSGWGTRGSAGSRFPDEYELCARDSLAPVGGQIASEAFRIVKDAFNLSKGVPARDDPSVHVL